MYFGVYVYVNNIEANSINNQLYHTSQDPVQTQNILHSLLVSVCFLQRDFIARFEMKKKLNCLSKFHKFAENT